MTRSHDSDEGSGGFFSVIRAVVRRWVPAGVDLPASGEWVGEVADVPSLLEGIDAALPRGVVMPIEGTSAPEVEELLADRAVEPVRDDLWATLWPRSPRFHIPLTNENLRDLRALAERPSGEGVFCDHLVVYDGDRILLYAHDVGCEVWLSRDLSEAARERFRSASDATSGEV